MPIEKDLPRIRIERPEDFRRAVLDLKAPFIAENAMRGWPALEKWTPGFFRERYGTLEFFAEIDLPTGVPTELTTQDVQRRVRLDQFVDRMLTTPANKPCYISNKSIAMFPGLVDDVDFAPLTGPTGANAIHYVWIGSAGTKASMHHDFHENVLAQVYGTKRVWLISPADSRCLYQFPDTIQKSAVDPEAPDYSRFPRYREATVYQGVLGPGECLYIPNVWWHAVRSLEPSISVNFFYGSRAGVKELLPNFLAAGPRAWGRFVHDFFMHGMLGRPYRERLYAPEPLGVWYYHQVVGFFRKRLSRAA